MKVIDLGTSKKLLDKFQLKYNEGKQLKDQFRNNLLLMARLLTELYALSLATSSKFDRDAPLPSLATNNGQLATMLNNNITKRSVINYINKLQKIGFISKKIRHGRHHNYELWITPEVLHIGHSIDGDKLKAELKYERQKYARTYEKSTCRPDKVKSFHVSDTGKPFHNIHNSAASFSGLPDSINLNFQGLKDKVNAMNCTGHTGNDTGNEGNQKVQNEFSTEKGKNYSQKIEGEPNSQNIRSSGGVTSPGIARMKQVKQLVEWFWFYAHNILFKDLKLSDNQIFKAKSQIEYNFYYNVPDYDLQRVHEQYMDRITLVSKYISRKPDKRFVPLPYIYFEKENPNGFAGTAKWLKKQKEFESKVIPEMITSKAVKDYFYNLRKPLSKQRPQLQMYRICEARVRKLNSQKLLDQFNAAVLKEQNANQ